MEISDEISVLRGFRLQLDNTSKNQCSEKDTYTHTYVNKQSWLKGMKCNKRNFTGLKTLQDVLMTFCANKNLCVLFSKEINKLMPELKGFKFVQIDARPASIRTPVADCECILRGSV